MTIAIVGTATTGNATNGTLSLSRPSVGTGNLLVLMLSYFQGSGTNSGAAPSNPTDTNGTVFAAQNTTASGSNAGAVWVGTSIWYVPNTVAGTHGVAFTTADPTNNRLYGSIIEFSGVNTSSPVDAQNSANASTAQTNTTGTTGTLDGAFDLVVGGISITSGAGQTNIGLNTTPSGYINIQNAQNTATSIGISHCYQILSSVTTPQDLTYTWTDSTTAFSQGSIAAFFATTAQSTGKLLLLNVG